MKPGELAQVVARVWRTAGYETGIDHRDGRTYVIARRGDRTALIRVVALGPDHQVNATAVERFRETLATVPADEAYLVTDANLPPETRSAAESSGIVAVDGSNLRRLAAESGVLEPREGGRRAVDRAAGATAEEGTATETAEADGIAASADEPDDAPATGSGDETDGDATASGDTEQSAPNADGGTADGSEGTAASGADGGDAATAGSSADAADGTSDGSDPFEDEVPEFDGPAFEDDRTGDEGGRSRRTVLAGGAAVAGAVLTAGVLDWAWLHVLFGGGGSQLPSYNETRVKREAAAVPVEGLVDNAEAMAERPVTYEGVLLGTRTENGLARLRLAVGKRGEVVIGRWDGDVPQRGARVKCWGVFRRLTKRPEDGDDGNAATTDGGATTTASESGGTATTESGTATTGVPLIDVVDLKIIESTGT